MEEPPSSDSEVESLKEQLDIREGIEVTIKHNDAEDIHEPWAIVEHPHLNVESSGKLDRSKLYVSDKEVNATIFLVDKQLETTNCSRADAQIQCAHQKMNAEMIQRAYMSQKMERFIKNVIPIMEEEVRQNGILENILW